MLILFSATLFLSAALLFLVQPMFAKFVLPLYGSTPAVWTTTLLFFQAVLLLGYAYAHAATTRLGVRRQAALHLGLLLVPLVVLPLAVPSGFVPDADATPVLSLLGLLAVSVGLPFFVVSSTAPLLQRWLADTGHPSAGDPYFLYRASNLGSIVGLLGYPLLMEPRLGLTLQGRAWALGYLVLVPLLAACAVALWRYRRPTPAEGGIDARLREGAGEAPDAEADAPPTLRRRARWVGLAFVPSSLLLGVTSYLTTDVAPVPLLWAVPLSLYLLSFIVAFSPGARSARAQRWIALTLPWALIGLVLLILLELQRPLWLIAAAHLVGFLVVAMVGHGELARDRPAPRYLTGFYLWVSLGGVLGGLFNAVVAPALFDSLPEYGLAVILAAFLRPRAARGEPGPLTRWFDLGLPLLLALVLGMVLLSLRVAPPELQSVGRSMVFGLAAGVLLNFARRPVRMSLGLGAFLLAGGLAATTGERTLERERSFFGIHTVTASRGQHRLVNGSTLHGLQAWTPAPRAEPLSYYGRSGPIGQALAALPRPESATARTAVIGLGTGTMACHGRAGQRFTFYEIDSTVERIARDPRYFTFLRDCPPAKEVVLGDARLSLRRAPPDSYDLMVADAFSSDVIPVHLVTREALDLYLSKLAPDGVLAVHVSNRYLDLDPVLGNLAAGRGLTCLAGEESEAEAARVPGRTQSRWVVMARRPEHLGRLPADRRWRPCRREPGNRVWTDDYSNVVSLFRWN
ncbi:MAG: spermidine synthase [Thermoleophilaceae bacterium]